MTFAEYVIWGMFAHAVADWFFQNDWQAVNKVKPFESPAAWVHGGFHLLCALFVFPWPVALILTALHVWIDTRTPLEFWRNKTGMAKPDNPVAVHVKIWQDQMAHYLCIVVAAWYVVNYRL